MINIQKFYSVYFGPILSSSVHFSSIQSILVLFGAISPHLFYYVHFSLIQSTMILFGPFCPLRSYLVDIGLICSYSVHYVHFGLNIFICSYSVSLDPFSPHRSTLFYSVPLDPFQSTQVHSILFGLLRSCMVQSLLNATVIVKTVGEGRCIIKTVAIVKQSLLRRARLVYLSVDLFTFLFFFFFFLK